MALAYPIERIEVEAFPEERFKQLVLDSYEKTGDQYPWPADCDTPEKAADWYFKYIHEVAVNDGFAPGVPSKLYIWRIPGTVTTEQPHGFILAAFRVIIDGVRLLLTDAVVGKDPDDSRAWIYDPQFREIDMQWRRDNGITEVAFVTYKELTNLDDFITAHWTNNEDLANEVELTDELVYKKTYGVLSQ